MAEKFASDTLKKRYYHIREVRLDRETKIEDGVLFLARDLCEKAFAQADHDLVLAMDLELVPGGDYGRYTDTILDVQPVAVKGPGASLGTGVTRCLSGVAVMICGKDEAGEQLSEAGSSEGTLYDHVCFGRPGSIDPGEAIVKINCLIRAGQRMTRPGPLSCHKAAEGIVSAIRRALASLPEEVFDKHVDCEETFPYDRRPGKPKVLLVREMMGQGAMHEKLLLPVDPCGIVGARSDIEMGNLPLVVTPLEALDGSVHALTCVGPASKETTRHYFRDPLVKAAMADEDIDLCGVAFIGSPAVSKNKFMVSGRLGAMARAMDIDGAIVATEGAGNNHIDFAAHMENIAGRGVPCVGVTYCGTRGPLITGNKYTKYLVECVKSPDGGPTNILSQNTATEEDAGVALSMLKALLRGEEIAPAPGHWDPAVRGENLSGPPFRSEIAVAVRPPVVWSEVTKPLHKMRVALVTGTGVHLKSDQRFALTSDSSFRVIPGDADTADMTVTHGGYDNTDVLKDINSMFPIDRLRELAAEGIIGEVAPRHIGFMGGGGDLKRLLTETGPQVAAILKNDQVDAAVFTAS